MADTMADPVKAGRLMALVMDPRTLHVMSKCAMEPVMWDTWMRGITDWRKMGNAMARFMDPGMYMRWMMAPMNPAMMQPMTRAMDPALYGRWMTAMMNPVFYQPMFSMMDPNWYGPRIQWMMNPASFAPMWQMVPQTAVPPSTPSAPPPASSDGG